MQISLDVLFQIAIDELYRAKRTGQIDVEDLVQDAAAAILEHTHELPIDCKQEEERLAKRVIRRLVKRARNSKDAGVGGDFDPLVTGSDYDEDAEIDLEIEIREGQCDQIEQGVRTMERSRDEELQLMAWAIRLKYLPEYGKPALHKANLAKALGVKKGRAEYLVKSGIACIQAIMQGRPLPNCYRPRSKEVNTEPLLSVRELQGTLLHDIHA